MLAAVPYQLADRHPRRHARPAHDTRRLDPGEEIAQPPADALPAEIRREDVRGFDPVEERHRDAVFPEERSELRHEGGKLPRLHRDDERRRLRQIARGVGGVDPDGEGLLRRLDAEPILLDGAQMLAAREQGNLVAVPGEEPGEKTAHSARTCDGDSHAGSFSSFPSRRMGASWDRPGCPPWRPGGSPWTQLLF